jgi:hypothetical protein
MPASLLHKCAAPECAVQVPTAKLMCGPDWAQVPKPLQQEVYAAWDRGRGVFSDRYAQAREAAIAAVTP